MGVKVTVREKKITKNRYSLYLDIYPPIKNEKTGKLTRREFLGIYVPQKPRTAQEKLSNKEQRALAEGIRQKRENEINKPEIYSEYEKEKMLRAENGEIDFLEYFKKLRNKKNGTTYESWDTTYKLLKQFSEESFKIKDLTRKKLEAFRDFLLEYKSDVKGGATLSINSSWLYLSKFKSALKSAYKDELLEFDISTSIPPIKKMEVEKSYLTFDELTQLVNTECMSEETKRACLFSALTGLRLSDVKKLTWDDVRKNSLGEYELHFTQKKTRKVEVLPISDDAYSLLNNINSKRKQVFSLYTTSHLNKQIKRWVIDAGIDKHITFHSFRHTYATLQLEFGTDIFTVSKMLGHKSLNTTMVYAKIVDKKKREATNKIKLNIKK